MPTFHADFRLTGRNFVVSLGVGEYFLIVNADDEVIFRVDEDGTVWACEEVIENIMDDTIFANRY